jgi:hypothetical protein
MRSFVTFRVPTWKVQYNKGNFSSRQTSVIAKGSPELKRSNGLKPRKTESTKNQKTLSGEHLRQCAKDLGRRESAHRIWEYSGDDPAFHGEWTRVDPRVEREAIRSNVTALKCGSTNIQPSGMDAL